MLTSILIVVMDLLCGIVDTSTATKIILNNLFCSDNFIKKRFYDNLKTCQSNTLSQKSSHFNEFQCIVPTCFSISFQLSSKTR